MAARKTGFDRFVAEQMKRPRFAAEYSRARAEIRVVDIRSGRSTSSGSPSA
jgi:hypothetical protein